MLQTLHIFRKDVRHLGLYIAAMLVLWIVFAGASGSVRPILLDAVQTFIPLLLPVTIWFLIVHVIQDEPLPGDRQFWITRPYNRWSLLAAKILFVLAFVNLPLLVSDLCIIAMQGLPVFPSLPAVLLRQIFVGAWLIVPLFTLATVTDTPPRCGLWVIVIIAGIVFESYILNPMDKMPAPDVALAMFVGLLILLAGVIVWQYLSRRTVVNRLMSIVAMMIIGCPLVGLAIMSPALPSLQEPAPELALLVDKLQLLGVPGADTFVLRIPVKVDGLPANTLLSAKGHLYLSSGGRRLWESETHSDLSGRWMASRNGQISYVKAQIKADVLKKIAAQPVEMRIGLEEWLLHGEPLVRVPVTAARFQLSPLTPCRLFRLYYEDQIGFTCKTANRRDEQIFYTVEDNGSESDIQGNVSFSRTGRAVRISTGSELPVFAGLRPVDEWSLRVALPPGLKNSQTARIVFRRARAVSKFNRTLTAENVRFPSGL